jgi:hypothetical protein
LGADCLTASSQVDYVTLDVKKVSGYFQSLLLWKWAPLFNNEASHYMHSSSGGGGTSTVEASRLVAEALDASLLPLLPHAHALHVAQVCEHISPFFSGSKLTCAS